MKSDVLLVGQVGGCRKKASRINFCSVFGEFEGEKGVGYDEMGRSLLKHVETRNPFFMMICMHHDLSSLDGPCAPPLLGSVSASLKTFLE